VVVQERLHHCGSVEISIVRHLKILTWIHGDPLGEEGQALQKQSTLLLQDIWYMENRGDLKSQNGAFIGHSYKYKYSCSQ
jgi:hypothetical protein